MADLREGLDGLREDMASHQRRFAGEVTDSKNATLAADAFQRLENELKEQKPAPTSEPAVQVPVEAKTERREVNGRGYLFSTNPGDDIGTRTATPAEAWFLAHALPRVELLLTKPESGPLGSPSWRDRTLAVLSLKSRVPGLLAAGMHDAAKNADKRYVFELAELLESSNAAFGNWKADPEKKIQVGARGRR